MPDKLEESVMSAIEQGKQEKSDEEIGQSFATHIASRVGAYYQALLEAKMPEEVAMNLTGVFAEQYTDHILNMKK